MAYLKKEKDITKKSGVDHVHRGQADLLMLRYSVDNPLHCDKCHEFLGIWHSVRYAMFKKRGCPYNVPCTNCGHLNRRVKGELGKKLDERWLEQK